MWTGNRDRYRRLKRTSRAIVRRPAHIELDDLNSRPERWRWLLSMKDQARSQKPEARSKANTRRYAHRRFISVMAGEDSVMPFGGLQISPPYDSSGKLYFWLLAFGFWLLA
jgi:hypothetical protein